MAMQPRPMPPVAPRSGWRSSKMHLALIGVVVLTAMFTFVVWRTNSAAGWGEYCLAIVSLAGVYSTSRVGETFANRKPGGENAGT